MDRLESNSKTQTVQQVPMPKREFSVEFFVGVFALIGGLAIAYLSIGLGGLEPFGSDRFLVSAEFDNVSGLQVGSSVEIAGVPIGEVVSIDLIDSSAHVLLKVNKEIKLLDDDIPMIRTKGIIGDRYVKISRGGTGKQIEVGGRFIERGQSVIDLEDVLGKFVQGMDSDKKEASSNKELL